MKNKKVLIVFGDRFSGRNIYSSNVLTLLKDKNIDVEIIENVDEIIKKSFLCRLIRKIRGFLYSILAYRLAEIHCFKKHCYKKVYQEDKNLHEVDRLRMYLGFPFPRSKIIFNFLNVIYRNMPHCIREKIEADIILVTNTQNPCAQIFAKYGKQNNISVILVVNSWDHLTHGGKAIDAKIVENYIVWNNIQKEEMIRFHGISPDKIYISGPLQFDALHKDSFPTGEVYKKYNINKNKKIIFYPLYNQRFGFFEPAIIKYLIDKRDMIKKDFTIIVRPYPFDDDFANRFKYILPSDDIIIMKIDEDFKKDRSNMSLLLRQSDVVICGPGTAAIEAMYCDTPVIHMGIDGSDEETLYKKFFFTDHYETIMNKNAGLFVKDFSELVRAINLFFDNPALLKEQRQEVAKEQIFFLNGKASEKVVGQIERFISMREEA